MTHRKAVRQTPIITPDGRYIIVRGRLWRRTNPGIAEANRDALVQRLMDARRTIARLGSTDDRQALTAARAEVHAVKIALGERGPVWWSDGAPDFNRHLVGNTPYAAWYSA